MVARIDGIPLTAGEIATRLRAQAPRVRRYFRSGQHRREFLDDFVRLLLLSQEAKRRGLDRDPDVQLAYAAVLAEKLIATTTSVPPVTDAEARSYYDAHPDEYTQPERVRVAQILLAPNRHGSRKELHALAQRLLAQVRLGDGASFRDLVDRYSDDRASRARGGDLGELRRADGGRPLIDRNPVPDAVLDAAFGIPMVGGMTLVDGPRGVYILMLTARYGAVRHRFPEVRSRIIEHLTRQRQEQALAQLTQALQEKARVHVDQRMLDRLSSP